MSTTILDKIKKAEKERADLLLSLLKIETMVRGSFCEIFVKCGKKSCWCVNGKGHSHQRLSWHEQGISFSRAVPKEDYQWIESMTHNFREYREIRKKIMKIESKISELLDSFEEWMLKKTKKKKSYLDVSERLNSELQAKKSSEIAKIGNK